VKVKSSSLIASSSATAALSEASAALGLDSTPRIGESSSFGREANWRTLLICSRSSVVYGKDALRYTIN